MMSYRIIRASDVIEYMITNYTKDCVLFFDLPCCEIRNIPSERYSLLCQGKKDEVTISEIRDFVNLFKGVHIRLDGLDELFCKEFNKRLKKFDDKKEYKSWSEWVEVINQLSFKNELKVAREVVWDNVFLYEYFCTKNIACLPDTQTYKKMFSEEFEGFDASAYVRCIRNGIDILKDNYRENLNLPSRELEHLIYKIMTEFFEGFDEEIINMITDFKEKEDYENLVFIYSMGDYGYMFDPRDFITEDQYFKYKKLINK